MGAILIASVLDPEMSIQDRTELATLLALVSGIAQILMGWLNLAFAVRFLSQATISGFTSGAAILIIASQMKSLFGFAVVPPAKCAIAKFYVAFADWRNMNVANFVLCIALLLVLDLCKRMKSVAKKQEKKKREADHKMDALGWMLVGKVAEMKEIIVIIVGSAYSYATRLEDGSTTIPVLGEIPAGLPHFSFPFGEATSRLLNGPASDIQSFFVSGIMIAFTSFLTTYASNKRLAMTFHYEIDASQELFALALFTVSFCFFKYVNGRRGKHKIPPKVLKQAFLSESSPNSSAARNRTGSSPLAQQQIDPQTVQEAEAKIFSLLELREFTAALNAYRGFEREGVDRCFTNEAMFAGFIQSAVRVGKIDVVERMLRTMMRNRMIPSIDFWHSTLKMLSSRKHYSSCILVFATYGHVLPNDKVIFSCLINAALESGAPDKAVPMLNRYQQCDLEPADFVTAFRTYVAIGAADEAEKLFWKLGTQMTPLMLNLVLLACINAKQPERAMNLLAKAHHFETGDNSDLAANGAQIVDTISYNTVIKGFVANGNIENALQCLEHMRTHNLEPDDVTLTSLLEISTADKTGEMTDRLVRKLLESAQVRSLDVGTCNLFIKSLIRAERLEKAIEIYDGLRNCNGSGPTIVTYSMLIKALVDSHNLERALLVVQDMGNAGVSPDEIILTHLLEGCRLVGNHVLGERLFEDMLAAGVRPSEYTLTMMVKLHGRCGAHEKAYQLVESWEAKHSMKPSVIHYTCVMSGCLRSKSYDLAWAAYQLMEKADVSPDEMLMSTLLPAMVAAQNFDRVLHLAKRALRRPGGIRVPAATLNNALTQMLLAPGTEQLSREMKSLMQSADVAVIGRGSAVRVPQASRGLTKDYTTRSLRPGAR